MRIPNQSAGTQRSVSESPGAYGGSGANPAVQPQQDFVMDTSMRRCRFCCFPCGTAICCGLCCGNFGFITAVL